MKPLVRNALITMLMILAIEIVSRALLGWVYDRGFPTMLIQAGRYGPTDGLNPGASATVWGAPFSVDDRGGRATGQRAGSGRGYRLFLGDSVGEGVGVADSACAVSVVAREEERYQVVNLCHIGYSTCDQLEVLRRWADTCSTIHRATVLFTLNDAYGRAGTDDLPPLRSPGATAALRAWLQDHVATYRMLKLLLLQGSDHYFRYDRSFYAPGDPHLATTLQCLDDLRYTCLGRNILLDVVMLPYRSQLADGADRTPQEMIASACRERGIPFTDVHDSFRRVEDPASLYLFADEIHLSVEGHARLARVLQQR